jgi:predicted TIM-barrel fold metal-dependent hydrolase
VMGQFFDAASAYFKAPRERPKMPEIVELYREAQIAFCLFTVDCESHIGAKRVSNFEIAEFAAKHDDICIPFASVDPHKGRMGAREARDLVENCGVKGFKFHHIMQGCDPGDQVGYPIYEIINHYKLPAIFHTGHSGMGTGMPGGGGVRLKYGQPMLVDDVAVDFPDMKIILAHPSWPWVDESLSMALHKTNVYIDLSGWSPKYFAPQIIQYANTQLRKKMLFGSDFPLIHPDKWLDAARGVGFREDVLPGIMKDNAARLLGLA